MKRDLLLVDSQILMKLNVYVKHLIPETLMVIVVVKKLIQILLVMILTVI
jgi:hypothetical protein